MTTHRYLNVLYGIVTVLIMLSRSQPAVAQGLDVPATSMEQSEVLLGIIDESFQSMSKEDYRARRVGGFILIGAGGAIGVGGLATLASGGDYSDLIGYTLLGGGALFAGLGFLPLNIKSETERMYEEFGEKPSDTPEQIQQKYIYWDSRFYEYAREQRRGRILIGIISIGVGLAWISTAETSSTASTQSLSASALPLVIGGITSLAFRSKAEKRYAVYERSKAGVLGLSASAVHVNAGIVPLPGGQIAGVLQVRF